MDFSEGQYLVRVRDDWFAEWETLEEGFDDMADAVFTQRSLIADGLQSDVGKVIEGVHYWLTIRENAG